LFSQNLSLASIEEYMLVISRKRGEGIKIGEGKDQIHVVILATGNQVKVGIDAPESVHILRDELEPFEEREINLR
jgi:carbon storage regulator CsrA